MVIQKVFKKQETGCFSITIQTGENIVYTPPVSAGPVEKIIRVEQIVSLWKIAAVYSTLHII